MAAIYCADIYCDDCADSIRRRIAKELFGCDDGFTPDGLVALSYFTDEHQLCNYLLGMDERDYDSGEYPKRCDDNEESDCPQHCSSHSDCINAEELFDGFKYGYFFGNDLTTDGEDYVKEAVRDSGPGSVAYEVWASFYDYLDFSECNDYA